MAHAADVWSQITGMLSSGNVDDLGALYEIDAVYLEPYNPPHNGNLLIEAYLKDFLSGKDDIAIETGRVAESDDSNTLAVEWTISYTAGGRRWNELARATFLEFNEQGLIAYQRDYS